MKRQKAVLNIPMSIAGILLCLTLFSSHLCSGLYAKYVSSDSGEDTARVAAFDVSENGACFSESFLVETVPGISERIITVENNSEVAVTVTVTIENITKNIPYTFAIDSDDFAEDKCVVTCSMEPNSTRDIQVAANWSEEGALAYMGMVDYIELTIRAEQID